MKKILVTGADGQLGRSIRRLSHLLANDAFTYADVDTLDLTDPVATAAFVCDLHPDYIINCAAYTAVDRAETDEARCRQVNRDAVCHLASAARAVGARMVHISTDYVFDGTQCRPYVETDPVNPQSVYGQTKWEGEEVLREVCPDALIVRTAWLYSEFGSNFVKTMLRLGRDREQLSVVFDQVGTPTYAGDLAEALLTLIGQADTNGWHPGTYHFSNEGVCSWYDFARKVMQLGNLRCTVLPIETKDYPTPARRPAFSVLNKAKIKKTFGIHIFHWENALEQCLKRLDIWSV